MQKQTLFSGPLSMGEILDRSFRFYRHKLGPLLLTAAVLTIPLGILNSILIGSATLNSLGSFGIGNLPAPSPATAGALSSLLGIVIAILSFVTMIALTYQAIGFIHDENPSLGDSLGMGFRRLLGFIWMSILQGLAAGVLALVLLIPLFMAMSMGGDSAAAIFCMVIVALVIFGAMIYLYSRWFLALPAFVDQKLGAVAALSYSWELTDGYVGRTFIFTLLLSLLSVIIFMLPATLFFIGAMIFSEIPAIIATIIGTIEQFFNVMWLPLQTLATLFYYYDLRVRKQGYDIAQRVKQFEYDLKPAASFGSD